MRSFFRTIPFLALMVFFVGCDRKNNPLFGPVSSSVTSATLFIPQIDTSNSENSRIFVSAVDQSANPIGDFRLGNFDIFEGDSPGIPFNVGAVTEPLYLALVIDRSGSMSGSNETAANTAAISLINALGSTDSAAIIEFESTVRIVQNFTSDKTTLINVINAGVSSGATAVYDATTQGAQLLQNAAGRRLLLVLTDGDDNSSTNSVGSAINEVNSKGLSAYMVGLGTFINEAALQQIATETGGQYSSSLTGADLSTIFLGILNRFNNLTFIQYHRRSRGTIHVNLTYGGVRASAQKRLD